MRSNRLLAALDTLLIAALACTMGQTPAAVQPGANQPGADRLDLAGTITAQAQTLQAPSPTPGPPTLTPTPVATNTPLVPQVSVSSATNCRTGPSTAYDLLWTMQPGQTADVVGKHTPTGYWIIKYPGGQCWLWGQYASVSGNIAALPEYPQPPTPTPSLPANPKSFKVDFSCTLTMSPILHNNVHVDMTWNDVANNENGYYIYRDGDLLATLDADSTSYSDDTTMVGLIIAGSTPPKITYAVQAFNDAGKSDKVTKSISCFH
jgi:hypothetical protein